jgi:hypothetical protein
MVCAPTENNVAIHPVDFKRRLGRDLRGAPLSTGWVSGCHELEILRIEESAPITLRIGT